MAREKALPDDFIKQMNSRFEEWRKANPGKQFKDFYGELVEGQLTSGKSHATLGGNLREGDFENSGRGFFQKLLELGLTEDDICVDYGCGTLRIGVHVIRYLRPGAYWGFDVADFLLDKGQALIGKQLIEDKKPQLRVIGHAAIAEAKAQQPNFLFSISVLIHVHPDEVAEYVTNVMDLIAARGQAIVTAKCSEGDTIQYSGRSWAHGLPIIKQMFADQGGQLESVEEHNIVLNELNIPAKQCVLRITPVKR